jgi:hypothetical protein
MHHIINSICTYRYLINPNTNKSKDSNQLFTHTFNSAISMLVEADTVPFPIQCLIQLFPSRRTSLPTSTDSSLIGCKSYDWMPLHWAIAMTGSNDADINNRVGDSKIHIETITKMSDYFGVDVWSNEDISPLSIGIYLFIYLYNNIYLSIYFILI